MEYTKNRSKNANVASFAAHECGDCDKKFQSRQQLKHHRITHSKRKFACPLCSFSSKYPHYLARHSRIAHGSQHIECYQCYVCKLTFDRMPKLRSHMRKTHPPRKHRESFRLQCPECSLRQENEDALRTHLRRYHRLRNCQICDDELLPADEPAHCCLGERPLACEYCAYSFDRQHALMVHLSDAHADAEKLTYLCDICRRKFRMQLLMDAHREKHTLASFACDKCADVFDTKLELFNHRRRAHTTRSKCGDCDSTVDEQMRK